MRLSFEGRVAIITGAGNGLGAEYAKWLASRGAKVVVNNRVHPDLPSSADLVVDQIREAGGIAIADPSAVDDPDSGRRLVEKARDTFGRIDIVIANAAVPGIAPLTELNETILSDVMEVNFYGSIRPVLAALPHMQEQNYGRVILTVSAVGLFGGFSQIAYGSAKAALYGFMRSACVDLRRTNILINAVSPYARTKLSHHVMNESFEDLMSASKVAPVVGWLASDDCNRSGLVLSTGAGRVRRAYVVESAISPVHDDGGMDFSILDDLTGATEAENTRKSSSELIPELLASRDSRTK